MLHIVNDSLTEGFCAMCKFQYVFACVYRIEIWLNAYTPNHFYEVMGENIFVLLWPVLLAPCTVPSTQLPILHSIACRLYLYAWHYYRQSHLYSFYQKIDVESCKRFLSFGSSSHIPPPPPQCAATLRGSFNVSYFSHRHYNVEIGITVGFV